nr:MAG TPA: hypothetical protein [Bacteriophage sp.]
MFRFSETRPINSEAEFLPNCLLNLLKKFK